MTMKTGSQAMDSQALDLQAMESPETSSQADNAQDNWEGLSNSAFLDMAGVPSLNYVEIIETVIASLEEKDSAMVNHPEDGGYLWKFNYGSVEIFIQLTGTHDEDTLTVWSPVLSLPAKDEPKLMRQLLEMNWGETFEARFGIFQGGEQAQVVVVTSRTVADLSATEISRAITIVANVADDNDEVLQFQYGADSSV